MRWVAAQGDGDDLEFLGYVTAPAGLSGAFDAVQIARRTWPACGVMPWAAFKKIRRAQLSLGLTQPKEIPNGPVH